MKTKFQQGEEVGISLCLISREKLVRFQPVATKRKRKEKVILWNAFVNRQFKNKAISTILVSCPWSIIGSVLILQIDQKEALPNLTHKILGISKRVR